MKRSTTFKTISLYWNHAWRYPRSVVSILFGVPLTILVYQFIPPLILADVLHRLSTGDFQSNNIWASFGPSLLAYTGLMLFGGVIAWRIIDIIDWKLEANVERDIARRIFKHLLAQSANFHANRFGGSLVSQTTKFMGAYIRVADTTVFQVLPLIASLVWTVIFLAGRAPLFVVLLLAFSFFYMVSAIFVTRRVRRYSAEQAAVESRQTGILADAITNVMAIKSFAGRLFEQKQFNNITNEARDKTLQVMRANQQQMAYFSTVSNAISALSLVMAVVGVMVFQANIATVFLILNYTANIVSQLFSFSGMVLRNYNRALGDARDMTKILEIEPEIKDPVRPEKPRIHSGQITFKDVSFAHDGAGEALFYNLNIDIQAGEKIGLIGHSGSGKTTFTRLLLRLSDIDSGEILIDGQNIAHLKQDDLRRHIAYVPQEPIMFHRSLEENIHYGQFDADDAAVMQAAKMAHAHEFIQQLPDGYNTLVGERGVKLSGGQRQRVAIARAMLKNAPILVLDEATSALDSESEVLIQDALWKLMEGRTAIVIAHRLSTIQKMDCIIVMDNGAIVEQGTHKQLMRNKGIYAQLWRHQSGGFIEE